ncbi:hypothetical protein H5397_15740 [Propioniciclava sp. MC1683]|uniref:hypothetical protein n=1 Tax=Propioniciclava sp. MC1683 TaxID=2760309 RepID=UPI001602E8A9|nr:hypothetical protein [Propioniciclava sp. MC1683]MBB1502855.1 hypothetical protein [Propioniciclava sp. MC1683]
MDGDVPRLGGPELGDLHLRRQLGEASRELGHGRTRARQHGRVGLLVGRRALLPRHRTLGGVHEVGQDVAGAPPGRPAHGRGELLVGRGPEEGDGMLGEVAVGHVGS